MAFKTVPKSILDRDDLPTTRRSGAAKQPHARGTLDTALFCRSPDVQARVPRWDELPKLRDLAATAIGRDVASVEVVRAVFCQDPGMLWAFERAGQLVGGLATLFLTAEGVDRMLAGRLDFAMPPLDLLTDRIETPRAIYWWAVFGRGHAKHAMPDILDAMRAPRLRQADNWVIPVTEDGRRFFTNLGFAPYPAPQAGLYRYVRPANLGDGSA